MFVVLPNSLCTQFVAYRVGYHPALGASWVGPLYSPFDWWSWLLRFYESAPNTYHYAFVLFSLGLLLGLLTYVLWVGFKTRSARKHVDVHGTAHFASLSEVRETGLLPAEGKA